MATPWEKSVDGIEIQFATNHVGGWLLGNLLVRGGKIGDGGRIVNVGSAGHRFSGIRFEDWNFRVRLDRTELNTKGGGLKISIAEYCTDKGAGWQRVRAHGRLRPIQNRKHAHRRVLGLKTQK